MGAVHRTSNREDPVVVVGAGIGGLASAVRLLGAGLPVLLLDRAATPGGKMRVLPTEAGPADTGPTVLTMRAEFEALFAALGTRLEDHIRLIPQEILARHFWPDGSQLDLFPDPERNAAAIREMAGAKAEAEFRHFTARAARLFRGFDAPMMQAPAPRPFDLVRHVAAHPRLLTDMAPLASLARRLARTFSDPRLRQLFGRYATYVGGSPYGSPALLELIWEAEARGVWVVEGGMHHLACTLADLFADRGGRVRLSSEVSEITLTEGRARGVVLADGTHIPAQAVVFNGDPRALAQGLLGPAAAKVAPQTRHAPRSFSAQVWAFASPVAGPDLVHHNVIFAADAEAEFADLARGLCPRDPTVYLCAQDRGHGAAPPASERFELILNAPPLSDRGPSDAEDFALCQTRTFQTLARVGITFDRLPGRQALSTPRDFERLFPATGGALYGQSPHGTMAAFQRPTARSKIPGLYLAGGGCHPGAGVPMAARSGAHAAAAIISDRTSPSRSHPRAMPGGTSMVSPTTGAMRSRSSPS